MMATSWPTQVQANKRTTTLDMIIVITTATIIATAITTIATSRIRTVRNKTEAMGSMIMIMGVRWRRTNTISTISMVATKMDLVILNLMTTPSPPPTTKAPKHPKINKINLQISHLNKSQSNMATYLTMIQILMKMRTTIK